MAQTAKKRRPVEYERHTLFERQYLPEREGSPRVIPWMVCKLCGKALKDSRVGHGGTYVLAQSSHIAMHLRNGDLVEQTRERMARYTVYVTPTGAPHDATD